MPFVYVEPDPKLATRMGVPAVPFLVDADAKHALEASGGEVQVDLMVDAWARALAKNPQERVRQGYALAAWAHAIGRSKASEGNWEAAEHYFRLGLENAPTNLSLKARLALSMQMQGGTPNLRKAFLEYQDIIRDPRSNFNATLWLCAARAAADLEKYAEAAKLLDDYASFLPGDDAFWDLYGQVRAKAGIKPRPLPKESPKKASGGWEKVDWEKVG